MPVKRKALGRGLDALLPSAAPPPAAEGDNAVAQLEVGSIVPNPYQPRTPIEDASLSELVDSIRAQGVIQPVLVRRVDRKYQLVAGERRWRAAKLAGKNTIPAIVVQPSESEMLEWALLENVQREDLNAIEEARAYQTLQEHFGLSQEDLAERVGKRRSSVANALRLLRLPEDVQENIAAGRLTAGHGRALLAVTDPSKRLELQRAILSRNLSVRQAEALALRLNKASAAKDVRRKREADAPLIDLSNRLAEVLGAKVVVKAMGRTRGRIEVSYASLDDLDRLTSRLLGRTQNS